jgi:hypothetical protein
LHHSGTLPQKAVDSLLCPPCDEASQVRSKISANYIEERGVSCQNALRETDALDTVTAPTVRIRMLGEE